MLLERYRHRLCTFNDDIQGTAAVTTATLLAAVHATGVPLHGQTIALFGSGGAGLGIASLLLSAMREQGLSEDQARQRIYAFNRYGLLVEGGRGIRESQEPWVRPRRDVEGWQLSGETDISLLDVVRNAGITALVGTSAQAGAFTEDIVRAMASHTPRPIIFPLSNPTSCAEATPADLLHWTEGRAIVGTGSPFPPVEVNGKLIPIAQTNNSYIFPGLALGILVSRARRVTDGMVMAAAKALAQLSPALEDKDGRLLPPIAESRKVGLIVAEAVGRQAIAEGVAGISSDLTAALKAYVWEPVYVRYDKLL
jgi:malate dehydrogenase (oxaloacetate-decarboxylating)